MSSREDIVPRPPRKFRRLSYTRRCGWIDWGHASPRGALQLKEQIDQEKSGFHLLDRLSVTLEGAPAYIVSYGQSMGGMGLRVSAEAHWIVRKGLSRAQRESAALGIFMAASHRFEGLQASLPFSMFTNSGYSAEDLLSNLIGFYSAFRSIPIERMRLVCGETSVAESLRIWDEHLPNGIGAIKNRTTRPVLFSVREGVSSPADTSFPLVLTTIRASTSGTDWVAVRTRFIDGMLVNRGLPIDVSRSGIVMPVAQAARARAYVR
jgi:hypothetical protein